MRTAIGRARASSGPRTVGSSKHSTASRATRIDRHRTGSARIVTGCERPRPAGTRVRSTGSAARSSRIRRKRGRRRRHGSVRAANGGDHRAAYLLALCHARGHGVDRDDAAAYRWACIARARGNERAGGKTEKLAARLPPASIAELELEAALFVARWEQNAEGETTD